MRKLWMPGMENYLRATPFFDYDHPAVEAWVQQHLPGARVVKVFNNIFYGHLPELARPSGSPDKVAGMG